MTSVGTDSDGISSTQSGHTRSSLNIPLPPVGWAILASIGPAFVWCAEYIGSGEVILSTRLGALFGYAVLWAPLLAIILKTCIGIGGARYTVCAGEGMMDMFGRVPGPQNWAVWLITSGQLLAGAVSMAGVAAAAGMFAHTLFPLPPVVWGWIITLFAVAVVWSGTFNIIKYIMSALVFVVILGTIAVATRTFPGIATMAHGIFGFAVPTIPGWAAGFTDVSTEPWNEILPVIGWAAGGFASQVWYTYWVLGAGYGMAHGRGYGVAADIGALKTIGDDDAHRIKGWCRVVHADAIAAMLVAIVVVSCFIMAGAGVLRAAQIIPGGNEVAGQLATVFGSQWGRAGSTLFLLAGCAALTSTLIGQLAGWPRLIADGFRICTPAFGRALTWKRQYRLFLGLFFITNFIIILTLGIRPVALIKISAVLEGLLFTPLQALLVLTGLYVVLPRLIPKKAWRTLRPGPVLTIGLISATIVFTVFCLFQVIVLF
jgi:Mn2+/Fe2+ NRAMP family transporter